MLAVTIPVTNKIKPPVLGGFMDLKILFHSLIKQYCIYSHYSLSHTFPIRNDYTFIYTNCATLVDVGRSKIATSTSALSKSS